MRAWLLLCMILLAGCGGDKAAEKVVETNITTYSILNGHAREFNLADGTQCVALNSQGITCNWKK